MQLSIIIPTRNRAPQLELAIKSLMMQTHPEDDFEIIIVDNGSTDQTRAVVELYQSELPNLVYTYEPSPGLHVGRHIGLELSKGEILVYADDDIEAFPTWLEGIVESFQVPEVVLVGGNNLPKYEISPPSWIEEFWLDTPYGKANGTFSILDFGDQRKVISPHYIWGCNFSIRKEILIEIGGFHPDGMPDEFLKYRGDGETSISQEILKRGYISMFNPRASIFHFIPAKRMTREYIMRRGYIQGISDSYTLIRKNKRIPFVHMKKEYIRYVIYRTQKWLKQIANRTESLHDVYRIGWWAGYQFHQNEATTDKQLLAWILQENYCGNNGKIHT